MLRSIQSSNLRVEKISSLGDKEIRAALRVRLIRAAPTPKAVLEELRVCNGNAIADMVAVHSDAHCYEIKSDKDSVERISKQSQFYDRVFRKVTLVTTNKHAERAFKYAPTHWGILIAKESTEGISFSYLRSASTNVSFDKGIALMTLWRVELEELATLIHPINSKKMNRENIANILADNLSLNKISKAIGEQLIIRAELLSN